MNSDPLATASLRVLVDDPTGSPVDLALVILSGVAGGMYQQGTTRAGQMEFGNLAPGLYSVQVVAAGYETISQTVNANAQGTLVQFLLRASADASASASATPPGLPVLSPKASKLLAKAIKSLGAGKPTAARSPLEEAYRLAPGHPYVNYLYGVYDSQMNDWTAAESYWQKALSIYPKHAGSLLFMGEAMLRKGSYAEATSYLNRAIEVEPTAWRPHAVLAHAFLNQQQYGQAVHEAERALELGHGQAAAVHLLLAHALLAQGNKERAITVIQNHLRDWPADSAAQKMLYTLRPPVVQPPAPAPAPAPPDELLPIATPGAAPPLTPTWMPPDVDEKVPAVEPDVPCPLDNVLHQAALRISEFVSNVDRFTATESLTHERMNKNGVPSGRQLRTFNYLVSIGASSSGHFDVEEFRDGGPALEQFPDRIATLGLPSLVLLLHPSESANFHFSCEGLARTGNGLSWVVHFRQRRDRPATMRVYRSGAHVSPVALKGRAWITADSFQIVRLETDLVSPLPEIRLLGEHTAIEYGPVRFRSKDVSLWLPQAVEIYFDWRGQRIHRRHSFNNYLLFSVDDKEKILPPKTASAGDSSPPSSQLKLQPQEP